MSKFQVTNVNKSKEIFDGNKKMDILLYYVIINTSVLVAPEFLETGS